MLENDKAIKIVKQIREMEENHCKKATFCREHNFNLDAQKESEISDELRRICSMIQIEFKTGYIA